MSKVKVEPGTNPWFVLYNIVFGSFPLAHVTTDGALDALASFGFTELTRDQVDEHLLAWHDSGMLRRKGDGFVIA